MGAFAGIARIIAGGSLTVAKGPGSLMTEKQNAVTSRWKRDPGDFCGQVKGYGRGIPGRQWMLQGIIQQGFSRKGVLDPHIPRIENRSRRTAGTGADNGKAAISRKRRSAQTFPPFLGYERHISPQGAGIGREAGIESKPALKIGWVGEV